MSPEQAKGKSIDRRSDMWAFGCVVYEMLTGRRAFTGEDVSDTLAEVIKGVPDWNALPPNTPESIRRLLRRCLAKDRTSRLPDAASARLEIDDATVLNGAPPSRWRSIGHAQLTGWVAVAFGIVVIAALVQRQVSVQRPENRFATRFRILLPGALQMSVGATLPSLAMSRDGRKVAFSIGRDPADINRQLWIQDLAQLEPTALGGTEGAIGPFFSPDGAWVAYVDAARGLRKVRLDSRGGAPILITNVGAGVFRGGTWGAEGTIVFASSTSPGLMRVADSGGDAQPLTRPNNELHMRPYFFPDGRALVYTAQRPAGAS